MAGKDQEKLTDSLDEILGDPKILGKIAEGEKLFHSLDKTLGRKKYTLSDKAIHQRQLASKRPRTRTKISLDNPKILYREVFILCNWIRKALKRFEDKLPQEGNHGG